MRFPEGWTLSRLVARSLEAHAAATAIVDESRSALSFGDVAERCASLRRRLAESHVRPSEVVGIDIDRNIAAVVAILAVLQHGCAYLPLSSDLPPARRRRMVDRARASAVIGLNGDGGFCVTETSPRCTTGRAASDASSPVRQARPEDPACILFTSGSTGEPKGVRLSQGNVANRVLWDHSEFGFALESRVLARSALTFDMSIWEIFAPLTAGVPIVILPLCSSSCPEDIVGLMRSERVSDLATVPSLLSELFSAEPGLSSCGALSRVFCGGEVLPPELVKEHFTRLPGVELWNMYGPTEATVDATYHRCTVADGERPTVPIGRAIGNVRLAIDEGGALRELAADGAEGGAEGELLIAGAGLGTYLSGSGSENVFARSAGLFNGCSHYRTGDHVRLEADGCLSFRGRLDHQVKIQGRRVELEEVDVVVGRAWGNECLSVLDGEGATARVVCLLAGSRAGDRHPGGAGLLDEDAVLKLRSTLKEALPLYAIPSVFVVSQSLPRASSGKVDRRAALEMLGAAVDSQAPASKGEASRVAGPEPGESLVEEVEAVLREVLRSPHMSRRIRFLDAGGTSLLAVRLVSRIRKKLGAKVPLRIVIEDGSADGLAAYIAATKE